MSDVVERAKAVLEGVTEGGWLAAEDNCGCYSVDAKPDLTMQMVADQIGSRADAEFIAQARTLVPELVAEVERLRGRLGDCLCVHDPESPLFGPSEQCPQHGRPYADWVNRGDVLAERIERVRALCDYAAENDALGFRAIHVRRIITELEAGR